MSCGSWERRISAYLNEELSAREMLEAGAHFAACPRCASVLNETRKTVLALRNAERLTVSSDFAEKLQFRLAAPLPARSRFAWFSDLAGVFRPRLLPAWGAGAVAIAMCFVLLKPGIQNPSPTLLPADTERIAEVPAGIVPALVLTAADPFEDLGAANLAAHSAVSESTLPSQP